MASAPRTVQAVVFDLDDTLYPESQYVRSGYRAVAEHLCQQLSRDEPFAQWLWSRFEAGRAAGAFDALSEQFGLGLTGEQIGQLVQLYRRHVPEIRPCDGVADMLDRLRARYKLGLLSDGFLPAQKLKLDALKLERFFEAVVFTEQLGRDAWKPSAAGFEKIREQLGVPHACCAYVADNPAKDFVAPNNLGWLTIQLLLPGQVHANNPALAGGEAMRQVDSPSQVAASLA